MPLPIISLTSLVSRIAALTEKPAAVIVTGAFSFYSANHRSTNNPRLRCQDHQSPFCGATHWASWNHSIRRRRLYPFRDVEVADEGTDIVRVMRSYGSVARSQNRPRACGGRSHSRGGDGKYQSHGLPRFSHPTYGQAGADALPEALKPDHIHLLLKPSMSANAYPFPVSATTCT